MLARPDSDSEINFKNWRLIGSDYLVAGNIDYQGGDRYKIRFRIYDIFKGKQLDGYMMSVSGTRLRRAAHHASDIIYEALTGERGAFNTEVAYVTASGVMNSNEPILSPSWSPDGKRLAYSSLEDEDGKSLALSLSKDGNPEIYVIDLGSKKVRRITRHWAIDTEPAWMPDGKSIIFTSDRGGRPQLYRVSAMGGKVKRLTYEGNFNARAAISPDGKKVAMIHRSNGKYRVAVLELETGYLQVMTDGSLDESPSFAPNGSMILYATSSGMRGVLAAVSVDGRVRQRLTVQEGDVREPAWSPFNK